ncbi:hypothetical protein MSI_12670 [Treponema sp. JC4]|uniref:hypothetical protein n=1 Tax=Treponema sp. JC4 TaxID=1124982 RepID=UPI00025B0A7A|nr:hypothetical protein [Treponema sp. JC4]EID85268.1 hypothetical protein MSI_12670 [Treponema sp. JC4]
MKKIYTILTALTFMAGAFGEGYFLNRLGACSDADGTEFGRDLFVIDENDKSDMHFAEYAEFSYNWEMAEILALTAFNNAAFEEPQGNIIFAGYGVFSPLPFLSVAAGNDLRDRFSFSAGEIYTENEAYLLQANPFIDGAGLIFNQAFGNFGLSAIANIGAAKGTYLNAGLAFSYEDDSIFAALQATGQNILNKNEYYHYAVFAQLDIAGCNFSAGYISNYNDAAINDFNFDDVENQFFLPLPSTHAVKASARYTNENFVIAADFITGLNKEYILNEESKKLRAAWDSYENAGFDPVIQGCDESDGLLGKNENIPWRAAVKGGWFATEDISLYLKYSIGRGNDFIHEIYPYVDWGFGDNSMFRLGTKIIIDKDVVSVSIPVMWKYMLEIN